MLNQPAITQNLYIYIYSRGKNKARYCIIYLTVFKHLLNVWHIGDPRFHILTNSQHLAFSTIKINAIYRDILFLIARTWGWVGGYLTRQRHLIRSKFHVWMTSLSKFDMWPLFSLVRFELSIKTIFQMD